MLLFKLNDLDLNVTNNTDEVLGYCMPKLLEIWGFPIELISAVDRFYKKEFIEGDVLPLAHSVSNSLLFSHSKMKIVNVIEKENLCGKDFGFWLEDSNKIVMKINGLRF